MTDAAAAAQPEHTAQMEPAISIEPPAHAWPAPVLPDLSDLQRTTREALGLPTDRAVVLSGHQPGFWHPGILAKYLAASAFAEQHDAHAAWVVVDQDETEPTVLGVPDRDGAGRLVRREIRLTEDEGRVAPGTPAGSRRSVRAVSGTDDRLKPLTDALRAHESAASIACQAAAAAGDLIAQRLAAPALPMIPATALAQTPVLGALIERMAHEPALCARAYNSAADAHKDARLRTLVVRRDGSDAELPLWRMRPGAVRTPVYASQLSKIPAGELAPRALLMTLALRLAACEMFIHGTGGGVYERATDDWAAAWLGGGLGGLSPFGVVTATMRLDLGVPGVTAADVAAARWRVHRGRHDPAMLGDDAAAAAKSAHLRAIAAAKDAGEPTDPHYFAMHDDLEAARQRNAARLDALNEAAAKAADDHADGLVAGDRTWSFALHPDLGLRELNTAIRARFGVTS